MKISNSTFSILMLISLKGWGLSNFFLANKGHELFIFEMLGTPMLYSFSYVEKNDLNIETFYPDKTYQTVSRKMINRDVYKRLMEINPPIS